MADLSDDDIVTFIPAQIRLTPFDRRQKELRELLEQHEELSKQLNNERRLVVLEYRIQKARERLDEEKRRDGDDGWRRRRDVDSWRAGEGRELRNASRRAVRAHPNENLSHMTPEEKDRHKRDQRADANFKKRQIAKGVTEPAIQAALALRRQQRACERLAATEAENSMLRDPTFGMF